MAGFDTVREVVVRSSQTGRLRVDIALLQKEKSQLLETLGELVVGLVDEGALEDVPESVRQTVERIKDVDGQIKNDSIKAHDNAFGAPRGYEPEAASDYGDEDHTDDDVDHHDAASHNDAPSPKGSAGAQAAKKSKKTTAKRRNHQPR